MEWNGMETNAINASVVTAVGKLLITKVGLLIIELLPHRSLWAEIGRYDNNLLCGDVFENHTTLIKKHPLAFAMLLTGLFVYI